MKLRLLALSFFACMCGVFSQSENDWRTIHAEESLLEFNKLEKLFPESHAWDPDDRITYLKKTLHAAQKLQVDSLICYYGEKLGTLYREMDSLGQALQIFNISYEFANSPSEKRIILNSLGGLHIRNGDYNTALDYYFEAVDIAKKLNDGSEAYPIGNISEVYAKLGDYENSAKYLNYSLGLSDKLKSPEKEYSLIYDYSYLVNTYQKLNKQDSAKFVVQQTLKHLSFLDTFPKQKYKDASFIGYYAVAEYFIKEELMNEANTYKAKADKCAQILYKSSIKELEARIEMVKGNYENALIILNGDLVQNEFYDKAKIIELQGTCYKALGNYSKAMSLKEKEIAWLKKNNSQDQLKYSSFANAKYELLQKNEAIKNLTQAKKIDSLTIKNQTYILYLSLALFGLFATGAFFY